LGESENELRHGKPLIEAM